MPKKVPPGLFDKETLKEAIKRDLKAKGRRANFDTALAIAACVFHGCRDRNGQPIAEHYLQAFSSGTKSNKKKAIGNLHDVVEDTDWTLDDLRDVGFAEEIVLAVDYVTRRDGEKYFDSIERCGRSLKDFGADYYAIDVKIADLDHNTSVNRERALLGEGYKNKLDVYIVSRNYLVAIKQGEIEPGTPIGTFMKMRPELYKPELLEEFSSQPRRVMQNAGSNAAAGLAVVVP